MRALMSAALYQSAPGLVGISLEPITPAKEMIRRLLDGASRQIADAKVQAVSAGEETRATPCSANDAHPSGRTAPPKRSSRQTFRLGVFWSREDGEHHAMIRAPAAMKGGLGVAQRGNPLHDGAIRCKW